MIPVFIRMLDGEDFLVITKKNTAEEILHALSKLRVGLVTDIRRLIEKEQLEEQAKEM